MLVPASRTLRARTGSRAPHKAKEHAVSGKVIGVHGEIGATACVRDGRTRGEIAVHHLSAFWRRLGTSLRRLGRAPRPECTEGPPGRPGTARAPTSERPTTLDPSVWRVLNHITWRLAPGLLGPGAPSWHGLSGRERATRIYTTVS